MWKYTVLLVAFGVFLYNSHETYGQIFGYEPNVDYPAYDKIPSGLTFRCADRQPGYYADIQTRCQVWHWCLPTGYMFSFLCPNGTVFNQVSISFEVGIWKRIPNALHRIILTCFLLTQAYRVCDWWTNVNCEGSEDMYSINDDLYRDDAGNLIVG
ncbi:U-scoloptoxin(01)-Er1a isoform X1 [Anopheles funestus]|uniref:U-scoloptoxin(01)-Er1a isoform X1 n=1 Tax=Anopheles funestus TaxID=62324 RepID=UPI0020C6A46B|nr:U-scoloptoxin(01)-Er1a isoform X1 [Anopheles funestus]